jgi:Ca2+/H+ antiporter
LPFVPFFLSVVKNSLLVSPVPTPPLDLLHLMILRGTLLALAGGLAVGAMGELVASTREWRSHEIWAFFFSLLCTVSAMFSYVLVSDAYAVAQYNRQPVGTFIDVGFALLISLVLYAAAVVTGAVCVIITGGSKSMEGD